STSLTPPAPVPTVDKADEMILQDTLQVSLAKHKSRQEQEARENVALVDKHLASMEIEKMVEGQENVINDSSIPRNDEHNILGTMLCPRSDKVSLEVEFIDVVIPVNVNDDKEEITDEVYELKQRDKEKIVKESRNTPFPTPIRSPRIYTDLELQGRYGYLFKHLRARFMPRKSFATLADNIHEAMVESLPTMVDKHVKDQVQKQVPEQVRDQVLVYVAERKEILVSSYPRKTTPLVLRCQRDPKAPALSLINQDLLYLKKGSSGPEKIVLSLYKFPVVIFNDDDIKEQTSRWVNKKQKEPRKPKEVIYSNSKITQVIKSYWELGHEHKFITEIVVRRANECIVSVTKPDFKNLNKNDIKDMYLLIMNGKMRRWEMYVNGRPLGPRRERPE
nr:hypothetical protein [Tanacetum cinerariifolium]